MRSKHVKIMPFVAVAMSLFLTQGVLVYLGVRQLGLLICYGLLYFLAVSYMFSSGKIKCLSSTEKMYMFVVVALGLFWEKNIIFCITWVGVVFVVWYLNHLDSQKYYLRFLFLVFFIIETLLGIYEKTIQTSIFPTFDLEAIIGEYGIEALGQNGFRATSLCGFPLANALVVSISMSFLLLYYKKITYRFAIWFVGCWSLFAFNARGATLVWVLISALLIIDLLKHSKSNKRWFILLSLMVFIPIIINYLAHSHWGGRLFHDDKILDGSAMSRIGAYDYYRNLSQFVIVFGYDYSYPPTENGYLNLLIRYGLVGGLPFILFQLKMIWQYVGNRRGFEKIILLLAFIGVGQTNNALNQPMFLFLFCLCVSIFNSKENGKNLNYHSFV